MARRRRWRSAPLKRAARKVRTSSAARDGPLTRLPVVLMTGFANESQLDSAMREGAFAVLPKALPVDRLLELVGRAGERRRCECPQQPPRECRNGGPHGYRGSVRGRQPCIIRASMDVEWDSA